VLLLADENFNEDIAKGLCFRVPGLDLLRVRDAGLTGADDPTILEWAANNNRILLTHDRATMPKFAYQRIASKRAMPGIVVVACQTLLAQVLEDLELLILGSFEIEFENQIRFVPL
jgi:predicted nuclease of predicted toxin-antitoxin system